MQQKALLYQAHLQKAHIQLHYMYNISFMQSPANRHSSCQDGDREGTGILRVKEGRRLGQGSLYLYKWNLYTIASIAIGVQATCNQQMELLSGHACEVKKLMIKYSLMGVTIYCLHQLAKRPLDQASQQINVTLTQTQCPAQHLEI